MITNYTTYITEKFENQLDKLLYNFLKRELRNSIYEITLNRESSYSCYIEINVNETDDNSILFMLDNADFNLQSLEEEINEYTSNVNYDLYTKDSYEKFITFIEPILKKFKIKYEHLLNAKNFDLL